VTGFEANVENIFHKLVIETDELTEEELSQGSEAPPRQLASFRYRISFTEKSRYSEFFKENLQDYTDAFAVDMGGLKEGADYKKDLNWDEKKQSIVLRLSFFKDFEDLPITLSVGNPGAFTRLRNAFERLQDESKTPWDGKFESELSRHDETSLLCQIEDVNSIDPSRLLMSSVLRGSRLAQSNGTGTG